MLLIVLRFLQGFSAGGEISGAVSFVAEHSPDHRRGLYVGMISVDAVLGTLLGSLLPGIMLLTLSPADMQSWGWRIPLLVALPLGVIGLYIRSRLDDTPHVVAMQKERAREENLVLAAVRGSRQWRMLIMAFCLIAIVLHDRRVSAELRVEEPEADRFQAFAPSVIALAACLVAEVVGALVIEADLMLYL